MTSSRLCLPRQAARPLATFLQRWGQQVVCLDHVQQSRVAIDRRIERLVSAVQILPREFNLTRPSRLDEVSSATASTTKRGRRPGSDPAGEGFASCLSAHTHRLALGFTNARVQLLLRGLCQGLLLPLLAGDVQLPHGLLHRRLHSDIGRY